MRRFIWLTTLLILAAASGCGKAESSLEPAAAETPAAEQTTVTEEGMCREHGVLEALCTKCNPKLAVVFQAKGDWCPEHGFPESICPQCHPERGGRPAVDVSIDDAPADGTLVIFKTLDTARLAGIETTQALSGAEAAEVRAPVVIAYEPGRVAQVQARSAGMVKQIFVEIGEQVSAGAPLAVIESAAVSGDQARLAAARTRVRTAEAHFKREASLEEKGISARKEALAAEQAYHEALAELESLQASLRVMGAEGEGRYTLKAPLAGVVTRLHATVHGYVESQAPLFEVVDTSVMWAELAMAEADLGRVRPGMAVLITLKGAEGHEFSGSIASIAPELDPQTRTAKVRVRLVNPEGLLRANMYGEARIQVGTSSATSAVPRDAVQRAKSVKLVFVRKSQNQFEARRVQVVPGSGSGPLVQLASGIEPGEEIVVAGSFFLKTETLKDSIGAGCCELDQK